MEQAQPLTADQQADISKRADEFKKEYVALMDKHQIECIAYPTYLPHPNGTFQLMTQIHMVDTKYAAKKSPMQPKAVIKE